MRRGRAEGILALALVLGLGVAAADACAAGAPDADALARQGKCAEAVPLYQKAFRETRDLGVRLGLANCLIALGRTDDAMKEIEAGVGNKTWGPRFLVARGRVHAARRELREAGIDFTRARELAPRDPEIRRAVGDFYRERGTWTLAIPEYRAALELDSSRVEVETALAEALFNDRQSDQALRTYRHAAGRDTTFAPAQLGLGDLLLRSRTTDPAPVAEAATALRRYTRLKPSDPKGWVLLARAEHQLGAADAARAALEQAHQLGDTTSEAALEIVRPERGAPPGSVAAANEAQLGHQLELAGRLEAADSVYRVLLSRDSTSVQASFATAARARVLYRRKDYRHALPLFDRALTLDPKNDEAHFYRGITLKELGRPADAVAAIRRSTELDPKHGDRFFWLGALEEQRGNRAAAEAAYARSVELEPAGELAAKANRQIGFLRLRARQWTAALPPLRRAVELDAGDPQAWLWLAQGLQNAGDRAASADAYRRVLELDPRNVPAQKGLRSLGTASGVHAVPTSGSRRH